MQLIAPHRTSCGHDSEGARGGLGLAAVSAWIHSTATSIPYPSSPDYSQTRMICRRRRILVLLLRKLEMTDLSTAGSTQMKPRIGIGVIPLYETRLRGRPQVCLGMKMSYAVQAHGDFTHRNRKSLISTCREWKPSITYHATPCNPHAHIGVERSPPDCSAASASPYRKRTLSILHTSSPDSQSREAPPRPSSIPAAIVPAEAPLGCPRLHISPQECKNRSWPTSRNP